MVELRPIALVDSHAAYLYQLLAERGPDESISHRRMPSYSEHMLFVQAHPYLEWHMIMVDALPVGAIYLSKQHEIGVSIFRTFRRRGYARDAILALMSRHPDVEFLANINPANEASRRLFKSLGFDLCQVTYRRSPR